MRGFIDLHCHFVAGIDDGARTADEGVEMLQLLQRAGFDQVVATPHMRPGLYDNLKQDLEMAYARFVAPLSALALPRVDLSSEHYFDDVVFGRIVGGDGLPYPGGKAVLIEFYEDGFPRGIEQALSQVRRSGLLPVIAHPERYRQNWRSLDVLERLVDAGAGTLLDTAALVGKYGEKPRQAAERILEAGLYHAACSDAHRPSDVTQVTRGMQRITELYDQDELEALFVFGPTELLAGRLPE